jgi:hypothetical protein
LARISRQVGDPMADPRPRFSGASLKEIFMFCYGEDPDQLLRSVIDVRLKAVKYVGQNADRMIVEAEYPVRDEYLTLTSLTRGCIKEWMWLCYFNLGFFY